MSNRAAVEQMKAAFAHELQQERDRGMADGAMLFLHRFKQAHGCTPIDALEGGRIAAREANLGLQWGQAAMKYIAELEAELREAKEGWESDALDLPEVPEGWHV